jgi:hypothetical protein
MPSNGRPLEEEEDIKMGVRETNCEDRKWTEMVQDRVQRAGFGIKGV